MFSVIENSVNLDAVKFDAFYLVKLIFGKYFCYFDANRVADLLQLDAICVLVRERVNQLLNYIFYDDSKAGNAEHASFGGLPFPA